LYKDCSGKLADGRCLRKGLPSSIAKVIVAPASSLNQSPLKTDRSSAVGVHCCSGRKRLTSPSESTVSAKIGFALAIESKLQFVVADDELPAASSEFIMRRAFTVPTFLGVGKLVTPASPSSSPHRK
jgi:hypothetical protein